MLYFALLISIFVSFELSAKGNQSLDSKQNSVVILRSDSDPNKKPLCYNDTEKFMRDVRLVPVRSDEEKYYGFRVLDLKPNHLFAKMGILKNDIIKRINGHTLNIRNLFAAIMSLRKGALHTFIISRAGKEIKIIAPCPN